MRVHCSGDLEVGCAESHDSRTEWAVIANVPGPVQGDTEIWIQRIQLLNLRSTDGFCRASGGDRHDKEGRPGRDGGKSPALREKLCRAMRHSCQERRDILSVLVPQRNMWKIQVRLKCYSMLTSLLIASGCKFGNFPEFNAVGTMTALRPLERDRSSS